jgi:hypothetical protein
MKSFAGFVILILIVISAVSHATQIVYQTPRQMGATSTVVVEGRVSSVRSFWNSDRTKILTEAQVLVSASHKGQAPGVVRVVQLGGTVGHVRANVAGALQWKPDEEVILFLEAMPDGAHRVAGFSQGKYRVERDASTGQRFVVAPSLDGVELVGAPDGSPPPTRLERVDVNVFLDQALGKEGAR